MLSRGRSIVLLMALLTLLASCGSESPVTADSESGPQRRQDDGAQRAYRDLTEKDDVLYNLMLAYNQRNLVEFDRVIDANFVFHFSQEDIDNGNVVFEQWDRVSEIRATSNMFDPFFFPSPITSMYLWLTFSPGAWTSFVAGQETWYLKDAAYALRVEVGFTTYYSGVRGASFAIRSANVGGQDIWRIVSWHDGVTVPTGIPLASTLVEPQSWGAIKALYSE